MCKRAVCLSILILLLGISSVTYASPQTITPGVLWYDTSSNVLSAHGGGILKVGGTYYWFGEYKDSDPANVITLSTGHATHQFVANMCYSSTDFANWTFENYVLTQQASGDLGPGRIVERPKVIYNDSTGQYVMYMHIDIPTYDENRVGVATCPTVNGNYTYLGSFRPLDNPSGDMTLFKDDDGKAYLISSMAMGINIYELTSDYLGVSSLTKTIHDSVAEAPAMFKTGGVYYLLVSRSTWWTSNDNHYYYTTSLGAKQWSKAADFTPNSTNTWDSQTTYVQPIQGSVTTSYVYMGDRWSEWSFGDSEYIWLPLTVNGTTLTMDWHDFWAIDTATGEWSIPSCTDIEDMHVQSIVCSLAGTKGQSYGQAAVSIKDNCGNPLAGVNVTGTFSEAPGQFIVFDETVSGTTNLSGIATLTTTEQGKSPSFTFCVDDVTGTLPYDSADNVDTCKIFYSFNW